MSGAVQEEIKCKRLLVEPLSELQETARHIASISNECKLEVHEDEYVESFKPTLMDVVYAWSKVCSAAALALAKPSEGVFVLEG